MGKLLAVSQISSGRDHGWIDVFLVFRNNGLAVGAIIQMIAVVVYWPLARFAAWVERAGFSPAAIPLESYRHRKFYVMRTDAYDRFCTRLEQRFSRRQIEQMLSGAGFGEICFSDTVPYWCALGKKR